MKKLAAFGRRSSLAVRPKAAILFILHPSYFIL